MPAGGDSISFQVTGIRRLRINQSCLYNKRDGMDAIASPKLSERMRKVNFNRAC